MLNLTIQPYQKNKKPFIKGKNTKIQILYFLVFFYFIKKRLNKAKF